jgi:predicted DsbA family dithiol-disulfide isomerase
MGSIGRTLLVTGVAVALYAAGANAAGDQHSVLATVGNYKITEQEVDGRLRAQLASLEIQLYEVKKSAVEEMADDYLLQQAAKKAHLSVDAYLKRELDAKVAEPSDADVHKVYEALNPQFRDPYDQAKPGLIAGLKDKERQQLRQELMAKLRAGHGLKILLKAPRFEVDVASHPFAGAAGAPVTIVEFEDFQNPYCRRAEETLKQVRARYGDKLRVVFADFPLSITQYAVGAAEAARCANEQGQFWPFHDTLLADQSKLAPADLKALAVKLKLDAAKFNDCFDKKKYDKDVQKDVEQGKSLGLEGAPAFFINGRPILGPQAADKFDQIIDEELAGAVSKTARK